MDTIADVPKNHKNYYPIKYKILNVGRHIKEEKKRRTELCELRFNKDHEYDPDIPVYEKYKTAFEFWNKKPFKFSDCKERKEVEKIPDQDNRFYMKVTKKSQCDKLNGVWNGSSINRENFIDDGVCWIRESDAKCGTTHQSRSMLQYAKNKDPKNKPFLEQDYRKDCNKDPTGCLWNTEKKDCVSIDSIEYANELVIPRLPLSWPTDITNFDFQNYLVKYYSRALEFYPQPHLAIIGEGNRCINQPFKISQPQTVINMTLKGFAEKSSTNRGVLVWHSVGSGKTCTGTAAMDAFWETDKNIVFVSSIEALASNPPEAFMECAIKLFPRFKQNKDKSYDEQLAIVKKQFEERGVRFFTFAQLAHFILVANPLKMKSKEQEEYHRNFLKNAVLIIDEVHNIFKPLPHQKTEHEALKRFLQDYSNKYASNLNIVILTATPGENPTEIVELINMVRDKKAPKIPIPDINNPQQLKTFAKSIRGLISYFDISSDITKYPRVIKHDPTVSRMSMTQYKKYTEAYREVDKEDKDYEELERTERADRYYRQARRYSNTLFNWEDKMSLYEFSSKMPALLDSIRKYPNEKHYIYSTFFENRGYGGQGVLAIAKILEKELGYTRMTHNECRAFNKDKKTPSLKKRYVLATTTELSDNGFSIGDNLKEMVRLFNHPENKNGEFIHVFLASNKFNEGVDFKALRHIHMFEPLLSANKEIQTIGRGARYCSHRDLNLEKGEWTVNVHKYLADFPIETTLFDLPSMRNKIAQMELVLAGNEADLLKIKGKRGKEVGERRASLKETIQQMTKELNMYKKELREIEAIHPDNYEMIDIKITKEVQQRLRDTSILLNIMKQSSIDCKLFQKFHAQSGQKYTCIDP
jgi:superfamily II DNA or RNA helicase